MTIDVNQFHGVFFDESDEHLQDMEQLLMTLDVRLPTPKNWIVFLEQHTP